MARPTTEPKPERIGVRLTADDLRVLDAAAAANGIDRSDMVRRLIRAHAA